MKILVKCLKGGDCSVDIDENTTIAEVKQKIESEINISATQQTLVYNGRTLQDDKPLSFYPTIRNGTKLHLAVKKQEETLNIILEKCLRKYYTEEHCKMIVEEFMRNFNTRVQNLSLDDLEKIAASEKNL